MWLYTSYYPYNVINTFSLGGRVNELFAQANQHGHRNNYSSHKGLGTGAVPTKRCEIDAINSGRAFTILPHAAQHGSPYIEAVWNPPGAPADVTRLIVNSADNDEIYFTDNHYDVYWRVVGTYNPGSVRLG